MSSKTNAFNSYETSLNGAITDSATSLVVTANPAPLNDPAYIVLEPDDPVLREVILVSAISGTAFSSITRGLPGSASGGQAHVSGAIVRSSPVHQMWDDVFTDVIALEAADSGHFGGTDIADHPEATGSVRGFMSAADKATVAGGALRAERITSNFVLPDPGVVETIIFNSVVDEDDPGGDLTHNVSTGVCTINTTGWYVITSALQWTSLEGGTTARTMFIRAGGAVVAQVRFEPSSPADTALTTLLKLTATDTIEVQASWSGSGTDEEINATGRVSHMSIARIR